MLLGQHEEMEVAPVRLDQLHLNEIVLLCKELLTELLSCLTVPLLYWGVEVVCDNLGEELSPLHVVPGKTVHIWFVDFCSLKQSNW